MREESLGNRDKLNVLSFLWEIRTNISLYSTNKEFLWQNKCFFYFLNLELGRFMSNIIFWNCLVFGTG